MEYYYLTTPQQNIWNLQKYYKDTAIANLCGVTLYKEKRDSSLLRQAILLFIQNQSGMRLRFCEDGAPKQYVSTAVEEEISIMEFSSMEEFEQFAEDFAKEPLSLLDVPMYRFVVVQLEKQSGILVTLSHLIADAWTFGLMANEVDAAYCKLSGEERELTKADYIEYIRSEAEYYSSTRYNKDETFWKEKYKVRPEESTVRICPALTTSIEAKRITKTLPINLEKKMEEYCRIHSVTPAVLFETALVTYLSNINEENQRITLGVPVLNRSNAKEKKIAGMFISTMPLTIEVSEGMTVTELAGQITRGHMELFRHQKYPYGDILRFLREQQNFSGNLYDVMISYQNARTDTEATTKWYSNGYSEVPLVIHIDNRDGGRSHTINVDYQVDVFRNEAEVEYLVNRLEYILEQITAEDGKQVREIGIIPAAEFSKVTEEFNDTYVDYPREKCVHELFVEQVEKTPEKVALIFGDKQYTYKELDELSNGLAVSLQKQGVIAGDLAGVLLKRDERVILAQLAVLKLGAVFIPIDTRYPAERINYIVNNSECKVLIKNRENNFQHNCVLEMENLDMLPVCSKKFEKIRRDSKEPCYIIFTSGSTGEPKGCVLTNQGLVNFCRNNNILNACNRLEKQVAVSVNTISFDFFIAESLLPLVNGYTVVLANEEESINPEKFRILVEKHGVNIMQTTPTRYQLLLNRKQEKSLLNQFDIFVTSGEALSFELLQVLRLNKRAKIFNPLGPSECSVWVAGGELPDGENLEETDITIGTPIANTQIYILDKQNRPVPIGVPGELCIAGEGVGLGYLNLPELTAEKFVPNPFATKENHHGAVMYHTGDLAAWRENGEIDYLG